MIRLPRFSAFNLAIGYVLVSAAMLAMFAAPLWYTWRHDIGPYRAVLLREEHLFWLELAGALGVIVLVGVGGGLMIRRVLLSEVHRINKTALAIVAGNLRERLPTRGSDELDLLALTVNRMLDQIENLIHGVRDVSNSIAHDLRTPLTELRSRLEELTLTRPSPEETFAELETAVADVDRVIRIFNALLRLAEIDTGARRSGFVRVEVGRIAAGAAEFYQPVAEERSVALGCIAETGLVVAGDEVLLTQGIANLIDNALKYSPPDGVIAVEAGRRRNGAIEVSVSDNGPGIPDAEKAKVIERFYRGDASRGTTNGMGLGLTLVAGIAKLHGGSLELADNHPGLRATLLLPAPLASVAGFRKAAA